ncbi:hypothetical protein [Amycolatopsis azurea]|uniref:hypothetical protein n=1 Tax=Amycolatopsis azurea TaxID=36819 RepID=UPI001FD7953A|nr:hypothetical protein [Amycolatopsis azurea]
MTALPAETRCWTCSCRVSIGPLQNGLWVVPGVRDVTARPAKPTESAKLVRKAFDTERIRARYLDFLARWAALSPDDCTRHLMLHTDWLHVIHRDPGVPRTPPKWGLCVSHVRQLANPIGGMDDDHSWITSESARAPAVARVRGRIRALGNALK